MRNTYIRKGEWNTKKEVKLRKKFRNKKTGIDMEKDRDRQLDTVEDSGRKNCRNKRKK